MLGQPLYGSTGPPSFDPLWMPVSTWIFAAQYFMEIYPNGTAKAAAGPWFNCSEGDILWTRYALDENWVWTLGMGVVGDPARTSTLVVAQPFMGLLAPETSSWREPAYSVAHYNGCWELYGVAPYGGTHYPSSSSVYDVRSPRACPPSPPPPASHPTLFSRRARGRQSFSFSFPSHPPSHAAAHPALPLLICRCARCWAQGRRP
jgi:hypothetical protein